MWLEKNVTKVPFSVKMVLWYSICVHQFYYSSPANIRAVQSFFLWEGPEKELVIKKLDWTALLERILFDFGIFHYYVLGE